VTATRRHLLLGAFGLSVIGCANLRAAHRHSSTDPRALFDAIRRGDMVAISDALARTPALLDARDADGASPLTIALLAEQAVAADLLLARGYLPDVVESAWIGDWDRFESLAQAEPAAVLARHPLGGPAMTAAARGGAGDQIWRVFSKGGVPDPPDREPTSPSPARAALEHRDLALAELTVATLLSNGGNPNAAQPGGCTILHAAAARGSVELVEMLVRKHADVDARDEHGRPAIELAERNGHVRVVELLSHHTSIARDHLRLRRAFDVHGRPYKPAQIVGVPLTEQWSFVGSGHFNLDAIREGLAAHPELVHASATTTELAVEAAGHVGQREIVELLLEHGAPYSMPAAIVRGKPTEITALLDHEPDRIHERGPHDFPLLWYPVLAGGSLELAELLLARGAEIEMQHYLGTTALHLAAAHGQRDMVALLLERGADPHRRGRKFSSGSHGETPREAALAEGHGDIARLLEDHEPLRDR
jgi:ankyrin repeat protein